MDAGNLQWEPVEDAEVLRVYTADPDDTYPQIALLRVPTSRYWQFSQDPSTLFSFVNRNRIFPDEVRSAGPSTALGSLGNEMPDQHLLVLSHTKTSAMVVGVLPLVQNGKDLPSQFGA